MAEWRTARPPDPQPGDREGRRGEGLDAGLLERAERLEDVLPPIPLRDSADRRRGLWSRAVEDLDTSQAALRRLIARARETGEDLPLVIFLPHLAGALELA